MRIITDSGTDVKLPKEILERLGIQIVPLIVSLNDQSFQEGVDITPDDFYPMLAETDNMPTTSQPPIGEFVQLYREAQAAGEPVLSIHISSGLSGTYAAAVSAAAQVPEADITVVDTKTLSAAAGWQVIAAGYANAAGWPLGQVLDLIQEIGQVSDSIYTLNSLEYLIHGGRISHMKGLIASTLNLKPLIGVEKVGGTYVQLGQVRSFNKAVAGLVEQVSKHVEPESRLRVQVLHSYNPEGADMLREQLDSRFQCEWQPLGTLSLVLGSHTGPSMIGVAYAPLDSYPSVPGS
jgi:DegV family protein with EDD domain